MNLPLTCLAIILCCANYGHYFSQEISRPIGQVWATVSNPTLLEQLLYPDELKKLDNSLGELFKNHRINHVELAFPDADSKELRNVLQFDCDCDEVVLLREMSQKSTVFSNPEIAPRYELLYDPDDYNSTFSQDYALDLINAKKAWNLSRGSTSVVIGISDQNFYPDHEELAGKFNYYNTANTSSRIHGTAVAITASGKTNNGIGKSSIGFNCSLGLYQMNYNEIIRACNNGAKVINVSWASGCTFSNYSQQLINEVYSKGSIIVAAAGNGSTCGGPDNLVYPASYNNVISVSSIGPFDNHERFPGNPNSTHQHNHSVDVVAPGYDIALSTAPGVYGTSSGTSFAAPLVSGLIGLMLSVDPCLKFEDVLLILKTTAINVDDLNPLSAGKLGTGRIDAFRAVRLAKTYNSCRKPVRNELTQNLDAIVTNEQNQTDKSRGAMVMEEVDARIDLFPNPSRDYIEIQLINIEVDKIEIVDASGKLKLIENDMKIFHQLDPGSYFVKLFRNEELLEIKRLIVQ